MAPTPQETTPQPELPPQWDGERPVISGMSGLYPNCNNIQDFSDVLYNKINPVTITKPRWTYEHPEVQNHVGIIPQLDRFDCQFFGVHSRLAHCIDCVVRKILEQTYDAIFDAGLSPEHLSGKKIGVYIGSSYSDSDKIAFYDDGAREGFGIVGCSKSMFANRVSYWLNIKGPSMYVDASCCSSLVALEQAYLAMQRGECDAAIVGGANLCINPQATVHFSRTMVACPDGKTKSFDQNADGCALSEAINILFVQKAKDALRIYAEILHIKTEYTSLLSTEKGVRFGYYRDPELTTQFLENFYEDAKVPPKEVEYVEAVGSAVPEVDKMELELFDNIFCKNRSDPLLVGSVISNVGYTESVSGFVAISKVLLGYQKGELAANLHCTNPRKDIAALRDGRIRIVTEHQPIRQSYIAVNSMSITGVNAHVLLRSHNKPKDLNRYKSTIPHLVTLSGQHESAVKKIINDLKSKPVDPEQLALLHNVNENRVSGHMSRGIVILDTNEKGETVSVKEEVEHFDSAKRPLWFVYSGMGSQWAGMGTQLMRIPVFAAAIQRCHQALAPKGLDIVHIITTTDKTIFDNILHSFVGIAAVQIGITDVLREIGLEPDNIIGHSVGELGCAYADGCFTAEEMILAAYSRGMVSQQTPFIRGSMAAVGIGYQKIKDVCPPAIEVACHNGPESCTISGPADEMREFVGKLTAKGIFAKEVPCSNIAFHSRYIADAGPKLMAYLQEVIKTPKVRSERWLSTSVPQERWSEENSQYSSAWYHTNNLLNSVLFEETSRLVPSNAVLVEVAPHGLLQAILKRSLPADCCNIPLTKRGHPDNVIFLLESIGKLYMEGYIPKIANLYPKVEFPVSTGTPILSHLVEWNHNFKWWLPLYVTAENKISSIQNFIISVHDDEYSYLQGHVIREKTVYPFAAVLMSVWDTLAMSSGIIKKQLSVEFRDVHLFSQPTLLSERELLVNVALHKGTGRFEVLNGSSKVAVGFIIALPKELPKVTESTDIYEKFDLNSEDIYALLEERDYYYSDNFQSIYKANTSLTKAQLLWNNNWVTFIDGILQFNTLKHSHTSVSQPSHINKLSIDLNAHLGEESKIDNRSVIVASAVNNYTRCGGVLLERIEFYDLPPLTPITLALKTLNFDASTQSLENYWKEENFSPYQETIAVNKEMTLQCAKIGDLDSLHWVETPDVSGDGVVVEVHYAAINDLDVKRATGVVPFKTNSTFGNNTYGMDFSGLTDKGARVMGMVAGGAASRHVRAQRELLWPVPAHWTLEDAATVPSAYAQAFYCLGIKTKLSPGMTVLVHGGAGALGQAAISIALAHQCRVFATVGTVHKKRFLTKLFPDLKEDHIGNSRDHSFADIVLRATDSKGCDIIISCVRGNIKNTTLKCAAYCGITMDTVQAHTEDDYAFGMYYMTKQRTYVLVDFTSIFDYEEDMKELRAMVSEGIARGFVRPLSRVVYAAQDAPRAFGLLAASRHRGRVLLQITDSELAAQPRLCYSSEFSQVIICDDQGFGVQLATRLINRGVKKLRLHSKKVTTHLLLKLNAWKTLGIEVEVSSEDLRTNQGVQSLLDGLGPIQGIYIIVSGTDDNTKASSITNLDLGSRKFCPSLKYFAVVTADSSVGRQTCLDRTRNQLPVTLLHLPVLTKGALVWRSALDAMERALRSEERVLVAQEQETQRSLLEQIATIGGFEIPENVEKSTTLKQLRLDCSTLQGISAFLFNTYNVSYTEEQIMSLTVQELNELEESLQDFVFKNDKGLGTFFSNVESDELAATQELVFLQTLTRCASMRNDQFDMSQKHLYIIPGLEGQSSRFKTMCQRLKLPVMVLQPGLDNPRESLSDTARRYTEILLKKGAITDKFFLLGYESGILAALEIASNLEKKGYTGTVYCVGGVPDEFLQEVNDQLRGLETEKSLEDAIIKHMMTVMSGGIDIDDILEKCTNWEEKLNACVRMLLGRVKHSFLYAHNIVDAAYARILRVRSYKVQPLKLQSQIILIRPAGSRRSAPEVLQQYSHQPIVEYQMQAPLAHAAKDPRCAAIINRHLSPEILEAYDNINLCESYLINADTFLHKRLYEDEE